MFLKLYIWAGKVAQWVKVLATNSDYPNLIPQTHVVKERSNSHRLSSDLHKWALVRVPSRNK